MTTKSIQDPDDQPTGIYAVPVVGPHAQKARVVFDGLTPTDDDSLGVKAGKRLMQGAVITAATGATMIVVL